MEYQRMQDTHYVIHPHMISIVLLKGYHVDKTHVQFKRGGYGYLHDALCADGYIYAV